MQYVRKNSFHDLVFGLNIFEFWKLSNKYNIIREPIVLNYQWRSSVFQIIGIKRKKNALEIQIVAYKPKIVLALFDIELSIIIIILCYLNYEVSFRNLFC